MRYAIIASRAVIKGFAVLMLVTSGLVGLRASAADLTSTGGLLAMCKSSGDAYSYCVGFISGTAAVMEQVGLGTTGNFRGAMGMCVSVPFPTGNAEVAAFIRWAEANSQLWDKPSAVGVLVALSATWPCAS
jgi:hypothetical protein